MVSDLGEHFHAGRLTAGEFGELMADLPAARLAAPTPAAIAIAARRAVEEHYRGLG